MRHFGHCSTPCPGPQQGPSSSCSPPTLTLPCGRPGSFSKERKQLRTKCWTHLGRRRVPGRGAGKQQLPSWSGRCLSELSRGSRTLLSSQRCCPWHSAGTFIALPIAGSTAQSQPHPQCCADNIPTTGTAPGGSWLIGGASMKGSPKPMEGPILISSKDWGPGTGAGLSPGSALRAVIKQLCTKSQDWRNGHASKGNAVSSSVALINDPAAAPCRGSCLVKPPLAEDGFDPPAAFPESRAGLLQPPFPPWAGRNGSRDRSWRALGSLLAAHPGLLFCLHISDCKQQPKRAAGSDPAPFPSPCLQLGVNPGDFLHLHHQWCIAERGSVPRGLEGLINVSKAL